MAKRRNSTKPIQPKEWESLATWKKYYQELATWEKEQDEKKELIAKMRRERKTGGKRRR